MVARYYNNPGADRVRAPWLTFALTDYPTLDDLRPDLGFQELRRRIGL